MQVTWYTRKFYGGKSRGDRLEHEGRVCHFILGNWKVAFEQIHQGGCGCLLLRYLRQRERQVQSAGACHVYLKNGKAASVPGIGQGSERMVAKEVREIKGVGQEVHRELYNIIMESDVVLKRNCRGI